jgi:hypothetical protein
MIERGASILLLAHSEYRGVYLAIAKRLTVEFGAQVHIYTSSDQEAVYYRQRNDGRFASVSLANKLWACARENVTDPAAVIAEARRNEELFGLTALQFAFNDRHYARGFALAGYKHPRTHLSASVEHVQILHAYNREIAFWREQFESKRPALMLNGGKVQYVVARHYGIPVRSLATSRYKNLYYWAHDEFFGSPQIERAYRSTALKGDLSFAAPPVDHMTNRARFRRDHSFWRMLKTAAYVVVREVYWRIRGYDKAKGYFVGENLAFLRRRQKHLAWLARADHIPLEKLRGRPFIFFPLATEPETALLQLSPEYFYQLPAIASLSRDMPAGMTIAVKEHYAAVGRRPTDFYGQIAEFKNVQMMRLEELGLETVRASMAVATISGSAGFEGAVLGRPVIAFGRHNIFNFLPHVMVVTDEAQLKGYLRRISEGEIDLAKAATDGKRFLQAMVDISFDMENFVSSRPEIVSDQAISNAVIALLTSLEMTAAPARVRA